MVRPFPVLRTRNSASSNFLRPQRIETELSHDVLEPSSRARNRRTAAPLGPSPAPDRRADIEVPNTAAAMNARAVIAWYPRAHPLIDGLPQGTTGPL